MRGVLFAVAGLAVLPCAHNFSLLGHGECIGNGFTPHTARADSVAVCDALCKQFNCGAFEFRHATRRCGLFPTNSNVVDAAPPAASLVECYAPSTRRPLPDSTPEPGAVVTVAAEGYAVYNGRCRSKLPGEVTRSITADFVNSSLCAAKCTQHVECTGFSRVLNLNQCELHFLPLLRGPVPGSKNGNSIECQVKQPKVRPPRASEVHWELGAAVPQALVSSLSLVMNGALYVIGRVSSGSCVGYQYTIVSSEWTSLPAPPRCDQGQSMSAGSAGKLHVVGGYTFAETGGSAGIVQTFDTAAHRWSEFPIGSPLASGGAAVGVVNSTLILCGGLTLNGEVTGQCAALTESAQWTVLPEMPVPVYGAGYATDGAALYVFGGATQGHGSTAVPTDVIQVYSTLTGAWTMETMWLPQPIFQLGLVAYRSGSFYLAGGSTGTGVHRSSAATADGTFADMLKITPHTGIIEQQSALIEAVHSASVAMASDGTMFVVGGAPRQDRSSSDGFQVGHRLLSDPVDNVLFLFINTPATFDGARGKCEILGGQLAIIRSDSANSYVYDEAVSRGMEVYWIGGSRNLSSSSTGDAGFTWVSPTMRPVEFAEGIPDVDGDGTSDVWFDGEPNNFRRGEDCVRVGWTEHPAEPGWIDTDCQNQYPSVCSFDLVVTTTTTTVTSTTTTPGINIPNWTRFDGTGCSYLQPAGHRMDWNAAVSLCDGFVNFAGKRSSLAVIETEAEARFVAAFEGQEANPRWVGAHRNGSSFVTVHGAPFPSNIWYPGEPEDQAGNDCVAMGLSSKKEDTDPWKLNDAACGSQFIALCEWCPDGFATTWPTTATTATTAMPRDPTTAAESSRIVSVCDSPDPTFCIFFTSSCNTTRVREECPVTCDACHE